VGAGRFLHRQPERRPVKFFHVPGHAVGICGSKGPGKYPGFNFRIGRYAGWVALVLMRPRVMRGRYTTSISVGPLFVYRFEGWGADD